MLKRCPNCKRIISIPKHSGDFVHTCNSGQDSLDNEDLVDYSGNWNYKGAENKAGVKARVEGIDSEDVTKRGVRASTRKTRQHEEYIEVD